MRDVQGQLSLLGVVNKSFLRRYRRHAVVVIVIAAAIITPTGDPFTLSVVAIPLYLLSDKLDTIPYEVLTSISTRVKRVYYQD